MNEPGIETYSNVMRDFSDRIERALGEGNSRLANSIYADQQAYIGRGKGNDPIVGARGQDGQRTA